MNKSFKTFDLGDFGFDCADNTRVDTPLLGSDAPRVRAVFPQSSCTELRKGQVGLYVWNKGEWVRFYVGEYRAGANFVDRGGRSHKYRLVSDTISNSFLIYKNNSLIVTAAGEIVSTYVMKRD